MNAPAGSALSLTAAFVVLASAAVVGLNREAPAPDRRPPEYVALSHELHRLDADLAARNLPEECFRPPSIEAGAIADLERCLDTLGPFFEQVEQLVRSERCKSALADGVPIARETTRLVTSRHRTNVLCARALVDLERSGDSRAAASRLTQALDLVHVDDDGRWAGCMITIANEDVVLGTLQRIVRHPRADVAVLREALESHLAWLASPQRLDAMSRTVASIYGLENASRIYRARREVARAAIELAGRADAERVASELALDEHLLVTATGDGVEVCADEVLAEYRMEPDEPRGRLLCWTVPR